MQVPQTVESPIGHPQGPFIPAGTLGICGLRVPAMNGRAILNGARTGRSPF
jgi:hypothetical protein